MAERLRGVVYVLPVLFIRMRSGLIGRAKNGAFRYTGARAEWICRVESSETFYSSGKIVYRMCIRVWYDWTDEAIQSMLMDECCSVM